jgi:S1-C subfamily serine protease
MSPFQIRDTPPRVGELCITLGTPLHDQYQDSVSLGVVSGTGRQIPRTESRKFEEVVQIDALINQGNSGGPLVDVEGRVIGVNFLGRLLQEGVPSGINFAISSEVVRDVVPELIEHGRMRRATIGASITARTRKVDHGFEPCIQVVRTASNDSPLKAGDYITAINGSKVSRRYDLMRFLNGSVIGRDVELEVERAGKHMRLNVRAEARPDN